MKPLSHGLGALFASLERRAQATIELTERVRAALPTPENEHVVSAIQRGELLIVISDSAAWGTRIRYAQQELLEQLHLGGETQFTKVRVKVGRSVME